MPRRWPQTSSSVREKHRFRAFSSCAVVVTGMLLASLLLTPNAVTAQEKRLQVSISYDLTKPPVDAPRIVLRPNTEQAVYFYVTNTGEELVKNLRFELLRVEPDGQEVVLQQTVIPEIKGKKRTRVTFTKKKEEKPAKDKALPEVTGPPFQIQVRLTHGQEVETSTYAVILMEPREYVSVVEAPQYDAKSGKLTIRVKAKADFTGPRCPVQLEISPDLIPGLILQKTGGVFKQYLTRPNQEVRLVAEGLRFENLPPKNGRIYLTIDGYERAFMFKSTFGQGMLKPLSEEVRVRIFAPPYAQPTPKLPVLIEADGPPNTPARLEFGFDRVGDGQSYDTRTFKGLREQHVYLTTDDKGVLNFRTRISDWQILVDATELYGRRFFRGRILEGLSADSDNVMTIADEENQKDETLYLFQRHVMNRFAPLNYDDKAVIAEIVLDATSPEGIAFVGLPKKLVEGQVQQLDVAARIEPRSERQAPLDKVLFFVGKLGKDGKLPEEYAAGQLDQVSRDLWRSKLLVPADAKDRLQVTVVAMTKVGKLASATADVLITPKSAASADKGGLAKVTGTVFEGPRPQANLVVNLTDAKGKIKGTGKTDAKGVYVIESVEPGTYTVSATKVATRTSGKATVVVPEGKKLINKIDIKLFR